MNNLSKNAENSANRKNEQPADLAWLKYAAIGVGGAATAYLIWVNRAKIQAFIKTQTAGLPTLATTVGEAVRAGAAKFSGAVGQDDEADAHTDDMKAAV